jgi:hypothetical protein
MSAHRNFQIELTEEQREIEAVRTAYGIWNDVLYQLCDSAYQLRALGESRQSEAMFIDAESMARRARLHLRNMAARQRVQAVEIELSPPANDNNQDVGTKDGAA